MSEIALGLTDTNYQIFCICQDFILNEERRKHLIDALFKEARETTPIFEIKELDKYVSPFTLNRIKEFDLNISYFYNLIPSYNRVLEDIENILKSSFKEEDYDEVFSKKVDSIKKYFTNEYDDVLDFFRMSVRIDKANKNYFTEEDIENVWKINKIENFLGIQNKYDLKSHQGTICCTIFFENNYKVTGNLMPKDLPLGINVQSKIGKTLINGISLTFENSPLGLDTIRLLNEDKKLYIYLKADFVIDYMNNIPIYSSNYINNIIPFFIVGE